MFGCVDTIRDLRKHQPPLFLEHTLHHNHHFCQPHQLTSTLHSRCYLAFHRLFLLPLCTNQALHRLDRDTAHRDFAARINLSTLKTLPPTTLQTTLPPPNYVPHYIYKNIVLVSFLKQPPLINTINRTTQQCRQYQYQFFLLR